VAIKLCSESGYGAAHGDGHDDGHGESHGESHEDVGGSQVDVADYALDTSAADPASPEALVSGKAAQFEMAPMHQFEICSYVPIKIGSIDASFTNASLWMVITVAVITILGFVATGRRALVPNRMQSMVEMSYEFVANMVRDNAGNEGMRYFPIIFTLFVFILFANMLGLIPYSFTVTSHIIVTFAMALFVFVGVTLIGFAKHGIGFLGFFVPAGIPIWLSPLLVVIEVVSYLTRPISLSVRLFANMLAGHTLLKVFAGFIVLLGINGLVPLSAAPLLFMVAFMGMEVLVAFLQAFVFTILTCIYLNDALHMHH